MNAASRDMAMNASALVSCTRLSENRREMVAYLASSNGDEASSSPNALLMSAAMAALDRTTFGLAPGLDGARVGVGPFGAAAGASPLP